MTIGIDASRANKKERTGVEWYSYFLIQEFKNLVPADTRVVLYMQDEPLADILPLPPNWEIKILRWPFRFWTIFRLSWEMLLHGPDIFFSPANILPFFMPQKTFTTIHDIGFKRFPKCYGREERWMQNFGVRHALKKSNTIFVPSEFTKKELVEVYGAQAKKIIVTLLGFNPSSPPLDKGRKGGVPYFLFIGRKDAKKNILGILEAFKIFSAKNPNYSLVLAGPSAIIHNTYPIIQNVILPDWVNSNDKQLLLSHAEIFLFPSLYEGFGLPILEAFAAGTPVITSNFASMPEVAGNAAILVNPEDPQEIADAMEKITKNSALKAELIQKGHEQLKKFSWKKCAEKTLQILLGRQD